MRIISILSILFLVSLTLGCSDLPPDLPRLYPCTISVIQDGKPLTEAMVMLRMEGDDSYKWHPMGTTDQNGLATMQTNGLYVGAPAGTYKVIVSKTVAKGSRFGPPPDENSPEYEVWLSKTNTEDLILFSLTDIKFMNPQTTPAVFEVKKQRTNTTSIDVGKAVRIQL